MIRRLVGVVLVGCALLALSAGLAVAEEAPAGPRLTFMQVGKTQVGLFSTDPFGSDLRLIAGGGKNAWPHPYPLSPPTWSGDGSRVAFTAIAAESDDPVFDIYLAAADGTGLEKLAGTRDGYFPVLSPDGRALAFARERQRTTRRLHGIERTHFEGASVWLLDLQTGQIRQLTPWRNGRFDYPSSFSPDGSTLAISRDQGRRHAPSRHAAVAIRLDGSGSALLARHAIEPVYSPDGTRLALIATGRTKTFQSSEGKTTVTATDLAVAKADGSGLTKLAHTPALELQPAWDPSGRRLAYTERLAGGGLGAILGIGDSIMEINADGSCRTRVLHDPSTVLFGVAWQPGPGREAGPIAC